jgi:hypothetical protein
LFDPATISNPRDAARALDQIEAAIDRAEDAITEAPRSDLRASDERLRQGLLKEKAQIQELVRAKQWDLIPHLRK